MDTGKLMKGMVVKNYKLMCELTNEEVKTSNSKKAQIKEWERYVKFHNEGHKFIVDEIYTKPLEKEDGRATSNIMKNINQGNYSKEMFPLVKEFVRGTELEYHSKTRLFGALGLKNNNYDIAYGNEYFIAEVLNATLGLSISQEDIKTILTSMWSISHDKIDSAFLNLGKLEYIYSYTNKLLCIYNKTENKTEVVNDNDYGLMIRCIYEGKLKALADYYARNPKKNMEEYIELVNVLSEGFDISYICDLEKLNNKLSVEIYLRGLGEKARLSAIECIKQKGFSYVDSFYYAYAYVRNDDKEWDEEILDIAKREIHIDNFKREVKTEYILNSVIDNWFDTGYKSIEKIYHLDSKKAKARIELKKIRKEKEKIYDILFDIFINSNPNINLKELLKEYNKEIKTISDDNIIPF